MTDKERFDSKCGPILPNGCIEWQGAIDPNGYGAFKFGGEKTGAHRAAAIMADWTVTDGVEICHSCDNRRCVNLDHLFVGSKSMNMQDAVKKNRLPLLKMDFNKTKLDSMPDSEVLRIYREFGSVNKAIVFLRVSHKNLRARLKSMGVRLKVGRTN